MSRLSRLQEYAGKPRGLQGEASSKSNLDGWSERAAANSKIAPRASDGPMKLPSTGKKMDLRSTASKPYKARQVDELMAGKGDLNHVGSPFMKRIRREA